MSTFASSPRGVITRRRPGSRPRSCRWLFGCAVALVTSSSLGCATAPLRFKDEPIVWRVDDAHDICARMKYRGDSLTQAAEEVLLKVVPEMGGDGGAIALDRDGNIALPFNTEGMYRGWIKPDGSRGVAIFRD